MEVKKYSDFLNEENQTKMNTIRAIYLISKAGEIVEKTGYIIFGNGIIDDDKKSWVGAIGEDMKLYTNIDDTNTLFRTIKVSKFNPDNSPQWKDESGEGI